MRRTQRLHERCADILGQTSVQAASRDKLRELLAVANGGVVFTAIQKFLPEKGEKMPCLSAQQNTVVIADEAHAASMDSVSFRWVLISANFPDGLFHNRLFALPECLFVLKVVPDSDL